MDSSTHHSLKNAPLAILLALFLSLWALAPAQATDTTDDGTSDETTTETKTNNGQGEERRHSKDETSDEDGTAGTGDTTEPQEESTADQNDGGANGDCPEGPYCSTRDGSDSENGEGDGEASGKPCAGCVGKADNKNPQGQMPDGSDDNAGYECDTNKGVGQGNPAHTGCEGAATAEEPGDGEDAAGEDAADAEVLGVSATAAEGDPAAAAADQAAQGGLLPATGANGPLTYMLLGGLGLLAIGGTALLRARRLRLGS